MRWMAFEIFFLWGGDVRFISLSFGYFLCFALFIFSDGQCMKLINRNKAVLRPPPPIPQSLKDVAACLF